MPEQKPVSRNISTSKCVLSEIRCASINLSSLGKYLTERNVRVSGYYSRNPQSSREAADFTNTRQYLNFRHLVEDSDVLFVAIPDSAIAQMWEQLKMLPIQNKIISHFSGALSSAVFSDIERYHAYGYSIHPLFAINDNVPYPLLK